MKLDPAIPLPLRIGALPKHKGLPVPAMVQYDAHGTPDFKVIDMEKWTALARRRGCGICGHAMGARVWFIGGPLAIKNGLFTDLPMHKDCAEFALKVCPYLALPRFKYVQALVKLDGVVTNVNDNVSTKRPEVFGLGGTSSYRVVVIEGGNGHPLLQVLRFSVIEWWQQGKQVRSPTTT